MISKKKVCPECNREFPLTADYFHRHRLKKSGFISYCKECISKRSKLYYEKNIEKIKEYCTKYNEKTVKERRRRRLKNRYNISQEEYNLILKTQNNCCTICGDHISTLDESLCVDHCHSSEQIRGLLCKPCNLGLGNFKDDIDSLLKAIEYLRCWNSQEKK